MLTLAMLLPQLALCMPTAGAEPLEQQWILTDPPRLARSLLWWYASAEKKADKPLTLGGMYVYPHGLAICLPDGYKMNSYSRGNRLEMLDQRPQTKDARFRTMITFNISDKDEGLKDLTDRTIVDAYTSRFQRFELLSFEREIMHGAQGVRLSFVSGNSPQLLTQQWMFNKNGKCYVISVTVENNLSCVLSGLEEATAFCDSLIFVSPTARKLSK